LLDARVELALAVRRQREARKLSQKQLGALLKTSQPRVAKIERAAADVSLDQMVRALAAAGGTFAVVDTAGNTGRGDAGRRKAARGKAGRAKKTRRTALSFKVATAN
jgi:transcriptional regulator with XRE-family HTH domain